MQVIIDKSSEFIGQDFKHMLVHDYGIKRKPIIVRNPQANAIGERIHQVIANMVRMFELETNYLDVDNPWRGTMSTTAFAVKSAYYTMLKKTPGQLVFEQDMIFNIQHAANWELIHQNKQKMINKNN